MRIRYVLMVLTELLVGALLARNAIRSLSLHGFSWSALPQLIGMPLLWLLCFIPLICRHRAALWLFRAFAWLVAFSAAVRLVVYCIAISNETPAIRCNWTYVLIETVLLGFLVWVQRYVCSEELRQFLHRGNPPSTTESP